MLAFVQVAIIVLRDCLRPGQSQHSIPTSTQSRTEVHTENRQNEVVLLGLSGHQISDIRLFWLSHQDGRKLCSHVVILFDHMQ